MKIHFGTSNKIDNWYKSSYLKGIHDNSTECEQTTEQVKHFKTNKSWMGNAEGRCDYGMRSFYMIII